LDPAKIIVATCVEDLQRHGAVLLKLFEEAVTFLLWTEPIVARNPVQRIFTPIGILQF
jgi:hypothetical protein